MAFNTPFKMWKRYEFNGGTCDPCIISWPAGSPLAARSVTSTTTRSTSCPTLLDLLGVEAPETIKGHTQSPFDGVSMRGSLEDASAPSARKTQFYAMLGSRSIWHEGWKAVTTHPTLAGWGHFNDDEWELYNTDTDRAEVNNLAATHPDKVRELVNIWFSEAGANGAFPLDDRSAVEIISTPRPQLTAAPEPLRLPARGGGARVAGRQHEEPLVRDRRRRRHPGARGARRDLLDGFTLRRTRPLRQGQPAALREQLRRHHRTARRGLRGRSDR